MQHVSNVLHLQNNLNFQGRTSGITAPDFFQMHFADLVPRVAFHGRDIVKILGCPEGLNDRTAGLQHLLHAFHQGAMFVCIRNPRRFGEFGVEFRVGVPGFVPCLARAVGQPQHLNNPAGVRPGLWWSQFVVEKGYFDQSFQNDEPG